MPTITDITTELQKSWQSGVLPKAIVWSLSTFTVGIALSCIVGIPGGLLLGSSKLLYTFFGPYVWAMQSVPRVSLLPLVILLLGFDLEAELTLIFLSAVFPIMVNCLSGVQTVDPSLIRAGKVFGASKLDIYRRIIFPYTLPFIISGINQGMSRGLVGMVIAEIFGGNHGLGFILQRSADEFNSARIYGVIIILVIFALAFVQTTRWLEVKVAPWRHQQQPI